MARETEVFLRAALVALPLGSLNDAHALMFEQWRHWVAARAADKSGWRAAFDGDSVM